MEYVGRVIYLDPNNLVSKSDKFKFRDGVSSDNVTWYPEDLNYTVDLRIISPNRKDCGLKKYDNTTITVTGGKEYISFLSGSKYGTKTFLTDNYTDISYSNIKNNEESDKESIGIKSIDINFDTDFFPTVVIKFTDVRGYSLLTPAEYRKMHQDKNYRAFFESIFDCPFPRFVLKIKGYYGNKITFTLAMTDFKTTLDASTGNFDITCNFIGYMYGMYCDIPANFLLAAPYMNLSDGNTVSNYWSENCNVGGKYTFVDGKPMPTFLEYMDKYNSVLQAIGEENSEFSSNEDIQKDSDYKKQIEALNSITKIYSNFLKELKSANSGSGMIYLQGDSSIIFYSNSGVFDAVNYTQVVENITTLINSSALQNSITLKYYSDVVDSFISKDNTIVECKRNSEDIEDYVITQAQNAYNLNEGYLTSLYGEKVAKAIKSHKNALRGKKIFVYQDDNFLDKVNAKIEEIKKLREDIAPKVNALLAGEIEKELGFLPSIENIYRMVYAHLDCFMYHYYEMLKVVSNDTERTCKKFNIDTNNTDLSSQFLDSDIVPPFPAIYNNKNEWIYPTRVIPDMPETDFVGAIIKGIVETTKGYKTILETYKYSSSESGYTESSITESDSSEEDVNDGDYDEFANISQNTRLSCYISLKEMYDRWLCALTYDNFKLLPNADIVERRKARFSKGNITADQIETEYEKYIFVDNFFNDIGSKFLINPEMLYNLLDEIFRGKSNYSIYTLISRISSGNDIRMMATPVFNNYYSEEGIKEMFTPTCDYTEDIGEGSIYVCMYTHVPSTHANEDGITFDGKSSDMPKYGVDGFDIADTTGEIKEEMATIFPLNNNGDGVNYYVPAFGVNYARQNQSYFKNVSVNMDTPRNVDYASYNLLRLSQGTSRGDIHSPYASAQDMFSVYSNRSYNCTVDMLGCGNITPMMYFQLNNIPMLKGAYNINKVTHHIENGQMTTTFTGVRTSKTMLPYNKDIFNLTTLVEKMGFKARLGQSYDSSYYQTDDSGNMEWTGEIGSITDFGVSEGMLRNMKFIESGTKSYPLSDKLLTARHLNGESAPTVGYGSQYMYDKNCKAVGRVVNNAKYTQEQCDWFFGCGVKERYNKVMKDFASKNPTPCQIDAMVDFAYNTGTKSWNRLKNILLSHWGNKTYIENEWVKIAASMEGLVRRRKFEVNWFFGNTADYETYR